MALGPGIHAGTTEIAVDRVVCHSGLDAGIQGQAGPVFSRERCAGCGLPSVALGPGIHAGTTDIPVDPRGPSFRQGWRNPGLDGGDRLNVGGVLVAGYRPWHWVPGSRHPCRDDG